MTDASWRSRIVETANVDPMKLIPNPRNWRVHTREQKAAMVDMLDQVGWVQNVIVNKRTGIVVDGHLRVDIARERHEASIPVVYVDLTDREEALVLASIDPLSAMAGTDQGAIESLLNELTVDGAALTAMLATLTPTRFDPIPAKWKAPTEAMIAATTDRLETAFRDKATAEIATHVEVICPACGEEFSYRSDLK